MEFNSSWSLQEIQSYVESTRNRRRGNGPHSSAEDCLFHLHEEIGELTREIRRKHNKDSISNELADCLFYLSAIATELNIDLASALHKKEQINSIRFGEVELMVGVSNR